MSIYTDEMIERMKKVYTPKASDEVRRAQVKELATEFSAETKTEVSTRSVIGKLTTEGVYVPYTPAVKEVKEKAATRKEIVADIASTLNMEVASLASFERSNRTDLVSLQTAIAALSAIDVEVTSD